MEQRKLYKTIESIIREAPNFDSNEKFLTHVISKIIEMENVEIVGGRLWKLNKNKDAYVLVSQIGDVAHIDKNFKLKIKDYPIFRQFKHKRAYLAKETDEYLIEKGIYHYSATGVGERYKIKVKGSLFPDYYYLYQYLIALNGKEQDDDFLNTLNIISVTLSSVLRAKKLETKAKEEFEELEKASEIQKSILPEHELKFGNYEIFGISIPDKIVGGDFFDYLIIDEDYKISVVIADAASKGISAAAQALYVSGALKMGVFYDVSITSLIKRINDLVYNTFPNERFVTLFYCELYKDRKGLCLYANAGHNSPLHLNYKLNKIEPLLPTGPVLGPSSNQNYRTDSINLEEKDILLLYTDGITEAANENFEFYTEERLKSQLEKYKDLSAKEICELIVEDVQKFNAGGKYCDDKTLVVIKRIN